MLLSEKCYTVSWISSASMHGVHDWFMHAIHAWKSPKCHAVQWWTARSIHMIWNKANLSKKVRHQIEQFLILRSFADLCARFAEFCARFAWPPFHIFSSFTHGSCKLETCSHPVQGHDGAAMLTDEPSNSKPSPMKGLDMFASAHPARPFMIACHDESGTLAWGWCRMYVYTLVTSASARASFKGMLVNSSSSENLNYKPNMSHIVPSIPKQFQRSKSANKWKIMSLEKKVLDFLVVLVLCSFAFFAYQNLIWTRFCVPKEGLGYIYIY